MAKRNAHRAAKRHAGREIEYVIGKGTSRLLEARVEKTAIRLYVNGPAMLVGSARILTSLDFADGATYQAWQRLADALTCTSRCGQNGTTRIPITVATSRLGTHLEFSMGPMSMYQSTVILKPKKAVTMKQTIDTAFGNPRRRYSVVIVPEPATGHAEHEATIFEPPAPEGHAEHSEEGHEPHGAEEHHHGH
jgi:hypothetical protein